LNKKHYGKKQQPRKKEMIALKILKQFKKLEERSLNTKDLMKGL